MKKLKGIVLVVILLLASIMMPFDVYAAVQSQIVPTFSSTTSQWNGHLYVTNFSDGTNNQASSTLSFTFDDDYYGIIYFDGYGPSNQHIANYAACFVAGGYGEYRYSYYQNGVINITQVSINIVNVVKPDSSVDLTQIIQLLTAIENDTSSIDNLLDSTLSEIRSVLSQLVISNGYLNILTQIKEWNFPLESMPLVVYPLLNYSVYGIKQYNNYYFPIFKIFNDFTMGRLLATRNTYYLIFATDLNIANYGTGSEYSFEHYIEIPSGVTIDNFELLYNSFPLNSFQGKLIRVTFTFTGNTYHYWRFKNISGDHYYMPLYYGEKSNKYISTDFALKFGLSNQLLDDIHLIAQGSTQSNSAASDLETSNDQMADDMDDLATIESGYNQQFNNQLQQIDFTSPLQNNTGILPAANFVITIFNGLINNNPFSVLIIVVCILLIGKKVIGK